MPTVKARIEALEKELLAPPEETPRERIMREAAVRYEESCKRYWNWVGVVFEGLENEFQAMVFHEIDGAEWDAIDFRSSGEFGGRNQFSLLTNAVLSMAAEKDRGRDIPHVLPRALCEWFAQNAYDLFKAPEMRIVVGANGARRYIPCWRWLYGQVSCQSCWLPLPFYGFGFGERKAEEIPREELPFALCPACGGAVDWKVGRH
jgi:hypothetical protein